jgi:hypothetical protein
MSEAKLATEMMASVKVRIFEERYSGGILDMNIFCLALISEGDVEKFSQSSGMHGKARTTKLMSKLGESP